MKVLLLLALDLIKPDLRLHRKGRSPSLMKTDRNVGAYKNDQLTPDDILSLIIIGNFPEDWQPRNQP